MEQTKRDFVQLRLGTHNFLDNVIQDKFLKDKHRKYPKYSRLQKANTANGLI